MQCKAPVHVRAGKGYISALRAKPKCRVWVYSTELSSVQRRSGTKRNIPDEGVDFLDGVLNFIVGISRFYAQLENETIYFVHDKSDFDTFLQSMSENELGSYHQLGQPTV